MAYLVTMQTIAKKAGVSVMTVSRSLNNSPLVRAGLRKKIQHLAKRLGYRPNPLVNALIISRRGGQTADLTTIAVIDSCDDPLLMERRLPERMRREGIEERAHELGFKVDRFHAVSYDFKNARINQVLKSRGIRGIIFTVGTGLEKDVKLEWEYFACVKLYAVYPKARLHLVQSNPVEMMRLALEKLAGYGYQKIGLAISEASNNTVDNTMTGTFFDYQSQIPVKRHIPVFRPQYPWDDEYRKKGDLYQWYRRHHPDAIISFEFDYQEELEPFGIKVPDDVAWAKHALSVPDGKTAGTLAKFREIGRAAVDLLVQQIYFNNYGIPRIPLKVMVSGNKWVDGATVPVKHPAALVLHSLDDAGSRGATCSAGVALATQVESLRNPAKPGTPSCPAIAPLERRRILPVATYFAQGATKVKSHRASWRRRVKKH